MTVERAAVRRELLDRSAQVEQHILDQTWVRPRELHDHDVEVRGHAGSVGKRQNLDRVIPELMRSIQAAAPAAAPAEVKV